MTLLSLSKQPTVEQLLYKIQVDTIFLNRGAYIFNNISPEDYFKELDKLRKNIEKEIREIILGEIEEVAKV